MQKFVEAGGTWVLGPLSACRDEETAAHRDASYGADLEKWLGIHVRHRMTPGGVTRLAANSETVNCRWWCDAFATNGAQKVLANYSSGPLDGFAAVVECRVGKGRVILFGTQPEETWLAATLKPLLPQSAVKADEGILVVERVATDGKPAGCIAVNTRSTTGKLLLPNGLLETLESYAVKFYPK